jgi:hypothetical protein
VKKIFLIQAYNPASQQVAQGLFLHKSTDGIGAVIQ